MNKLDKLRDELRWIPPATSRHAEVLTRAREMLQTQARRIAELEGELHGWVQGSDVEAREADRGRKRIAELEAGRGQR